MQNQSPVRADDPREHLKGTHDKVKIYETDNYSFSFSLYIPQAQFIPVRIIQHLYILHKSFKGSDFNVISSQVEQSFHYICSL
jgi:hypothetical protein